MTKTSAAVAAKTPPRKKVTAQKLKKEKSRHDAKRRAADAVAATQPKKSVLKKKSQKKTEEEAEAESPHVTFNTKPEVHMTTPPRTTRPRSSQEPVNSPQMSLNKARDIIDDMNGSEEPQETSSEALR